MEVREVPPALIHGVQQLRRFPEPVLRGPVAFAQDRTDSPKPVVPGKTFVTFTHNDVGELGNQLESRVNPYVSGG
ncbi:hypothetical protein Pme01_22530 [Planosporangium mesophilum]|uniref:Uncharacterized protein n=1 Tax=Planosporangium mesophilum TaxID=689768 RepID=A0A8J3X0G3_9ACTN|nr:hypothetical protein Pme01_22530 [Planosporangium mesophilum]